MYEPSPLSQTRLSDTMTRSRKPHYTGSNPFQDDLADYEEKQLSQLNATKKMNSRAMSKASEELKDDVAAVTQSLAANEEEVETLKQSLREESDNVMHLTNELAKVA
ncbi:unnamed protein product [Sphagnum troendelagicum]|uniref:Uncharacterized protein n=1 Tax=Sphagnum troendelagicum TaxID=128251 RepID=A0ABP0TYR2_9BRYO